jgi:hypothetical protein
VLRAGYAKDSSGGTVSTGAITLGRTYWVVLAVKRSTGAADGYVAVYLDGVQAAKSVLIENTNKHATINSVKVGTTATSGSTGQLIYVDDLSAYVDVAGYTPEPLPTPFDPAFDSLQPGTTSYAG